MSDFLAYELLPRILNMSIATSVVIVFVLAARLLLKKAPKVFSYALWSVVLFRLLCLQASHCWPLPMHPSGRLLPTPPRSNMSSRTWSILNFPRWTFQSPV